MVYFSLCFFFSYAWEEEDAIVFFFHFFVSIWNEEGDSTNVPLPFFLLLFFVTNKVTKTSLLPSQNFPLLPTYPPSYLLPTYLPTSPHFPFTSLLKPMRGWSKKAKEVGKNYEPEAGGQKWQPRKSTWNGRAKVRGKNYEPKVGGQNYKPKAGGQNWQLGESAWNWKAKIRGQKQEPKVKGQSKSLKVSSFPSHDFFCCFLACFVFYVF